MSRPATLLRVLIVFALTASGCAAAPRPTRSPVTSIPASALPTAAATATAATAAPVTAAPATAAPQTSPPARSAAPASPVTIPAALTDALRIELASMTVKVGEPVTFVVTNEGGLIHEFFLGDAAAQDAHEAAVVASGLEAPVDSETGIAVEAGEVEELTFVFTSPGEWIAGCHVRNHYAGGMKATITAIP